MDIAEKKIELIEWLTKIEDQSLLEKVEFLKKASTAKDYENHLRPMTSQNYKSILDQSEKEYNNGKVISQEDLEKESENW